MLRDNMNLQKKEMQTARADIGDAVAVTANIDGRFHMLESEMRGLWKKMTDEQAARDKAAADKPFPVMPVSFYNHHIHTHSHLVSWSYTHKCFSKMMSVVLLLMILMSINLHHASRKPEALDIACAVWESSTCLFHVCVSSFINVTISFLDKCSSVQVNIQRGTVCIQFPYCLRTCMPCYISFWSVTQR